MSKFETPITLTPREYEIAVKEILDAAGSCLEQYESAHLESIMGSDGEYVIDVVAKFTALGAKIIVLVECKHEKRKVERQQVQVLWSKLQSAGAHKGMLFSVSGFQSGAVEFAEAHGIALIHLAEGSTAWVTKSFSPTVATPSFVPKYVGWWCHGRSMSLVSADHVEYTLQALGAAKPEP